ncbi:MAG: DegT/DnrJ/EryC1/StrS family aminotransferase [bacterium]|nr:DegT/DnrJ/EryC1/StrS family aminotransferase [bacterium]
MKIPLFKPNLGKEELRNLAQVFKTGWVGAGPKTQELEAQFAKSIGARHAIGVTSCTAALHIAAQALGIKKGDEVIVPATTVISTPYAALYNGATPVFADVEEDTLCLDPEDFERKITSKTKAVIPVHLGGHSCDMDRIMKIARKYKLYVIEDCANAQGTKYKGRPVGIFGNIGCFSFEAKKNMTTGDGGMLTTNSLQWAEKLRAFRWYGSRNDTWKRFSGNNKYSWHYDVAELGWKYNMNDIMAAIGLAQFKKLPLALSKKDKIRARYNKELQGISWLATPKDRSYTHSGYWLYVIRIKNGRRDKFIKYMGEKGITTGVHFPPVYHHSYFKKLGISAFCPVAEKVGKEIVSLPFFSTMKPSEFSYVVKSIRQFR